MICRIVELIFTGVGLLFIIVGWIIPFKQSLGLNDLNQKAQLKQVQRAWKMQLIDEQISKYYGPISAIIKEQSIIKQRIQYQIGRQVIFDNGKDRLADLTRDEQLIWKHFVDTYKIPLQHKIIEIMENNAHLAVHGEHDIYVDKFLDYVLGWELLDSQKQKGVPNYYEYYYSFNYPVGFNQYINSTLENLLNEKHALMQELNT